jgi:copper(I)-binding protein
VIRSSRGGTASRRILIAAAAALVPLIGGCEAGTNAPTLHWHPPTSGTHETLGSLTISDAFVLGAPIGKVLHSGQNAGLFLGLTNVGTGSDRLLAVHAPGVAGKVQLPAGGVNLAAKGQVLLTGPQPQIVLTDLTHPLSGGSVITIYLRFARAGTTRLQVPVMPASSFYTTLSPAPSASSPSPSPSTSGKNKHGSSSASPSPSSS